MLGSKVRINGLFHIFVNGILIGGYNSLILTIDPNFLGHPSAQMSRFSLAVNSRQRQPENSDASPGLRLTNLTKKSDAAGSRVDTPARKLTWLAGNRHVYRGY